MKTHHHHNGPTRLITPRLGGGDEHARMFSEFQVYSSKSGILVVLVLVQFYLLKFESFCQLFEPNVLFRVEFCSRSCCRCAILMLFLMSTNFNWPRSETTLLTTANIQILTVSMEKQQYQVLSEQILKYR